MWWPHLRRLWAAAGTVSAGLAVDYLYGWLGNQPAPALLAAYRLYVAIPLLEPECAAHIRHRVGLRQAAIPRVRGACPAATEAKGLLEELAK